ncbi:MAG: hypothetical protein M1501_01465 [Candidatus Omnitrophica bacterium]|nr:hypothetical protein [Candidatus Omnitrophota bacterium]
MLRKQTVKKFKKPKRLDPAIIENVIWFSKFTPLEKLAIYEKQCERVKKFKGLALKYKNAQKVSL